MKTGGKQPKPPGKGRAASEEKGAREASSSKPARAPGALARIWKQVDKFWLSIGLALFLGLGMGILAFMVQSREKHLSERKQLVAAEVAALAATLRKHSALPFHPNPAYLKLLTDLTRTRSALEELAASEGAPDADRQAFLEGELAELMSAYAQARAAARVESDLGEVQKAFQRSATVLERLHQSSRLQAPVWAGELTEAFNGVGLNPSILTGFEVRLEKVKETAQGLENALGVALLEAQRLRQPGYEVVSFMPDQKRTTVIGGGWAATGFGSDSHVPGGIVAFSLEGTTLVHRLLNAGTWKSLARVEPSPHGPLHYVVDTATLQLSEHGSLHAEAVLKAARALEEAWKALNPMAPELTFKQAPQKTFDDIFVQLEADLNSGTPDGKPELEQWPSEGEIAIVNGYFGDKADLVLLRYPQAGALRLQVLAREGFVYTNACALDDGHLAVLPDGLLLRLGEVQIPSAAGSQTFKVIQTLDRPRAKRMPSS